MLDNKFIDSIIERVKEIGKPDDRPMVYVENDKGELILSLLALDKEESIIALISLMKMTGCKEMIVIQTAYFSTMKPGEKMKYQPSQDPNRKEAFIINHFSKEGTKAIMLEYENINNKCVWKDNEFSKKLQVVESRFNPFTKTEKEIKELMNSIDENRLRKEGKKEVIKLKFKHHIDVYRLEDKIFFETFNDKKCFFKTKVVKDDDEFENSLKFLVESLNKLGDENNDN